MFSYFVVLFQQQHYQRTRLLIDLANLAANNLLLTQFLNLPRKLYNPTSLPSTIDSPHQSPKQQAEHIHNMRLNIRLEQPVVGWQYGSILFNKRAFAMIYNIKVDKFLNQVVVEVLILLL